MPGENIPFDHILATPFERSLTNQADSLKLPDSNGDSEAIVQKNKFRIHESFPLMQALQQCGFFESNSNFLLDSPTGSGKTHAVSQLARYEIAHGHSCVIAVPLRALATELYEHLCHDASFPRGGVSLCTGAARRGRPWRIGALTICTYESLWLRVNLQHLEWLSTVAFVAIDEIHLLESSRGPQLEELLIRLFRLAPFCRIIALSGTLDPADETLRAWLDAAYIRMPIRPVSLHLHTEFIPASQRFCKIQETLKQDPRPSLIFVHSRRRATQWARQLSEAGIPSAVHHAGLSFAAQRRVVENLQSGRLQAVVATPTLEMGINLPVERVFCPDLVFPDGFKWKRISARTLHQRLGRAGRHINSQSTAEGIVFAPPARSDPLLEPFGPVISRFSETLDAFILHELADKLCRNRMQLQRSYALSLAARRNMSPDWELALEKLQTRGFITSVNPQNWEQPLELTPLGKVAARQFGALGAFSGSLSILRRECAPFDVLWLAFCCLEIENWLDFGQLWELANFLTNTPSFLLSNPQNFYIALHLSHRQTVCALAATAAFLAWSETPKSKRDEMSYWNTSYEIHRIRTWRARRTVDSWARVVSSLPMDFSYPVTRESILSVQEFFRHPSASIREHISCCNAPLVAFPSPPVLARPDLSEEMEMRFQRALQCQVRPTEDGCFFVRHQGPEYLVQNNACTCADFSPLRPCKHVFAVEIHRLRSSVPLHAFNLWEAS